MGLTPQPCTGLAGRGEISWWRDAAWTARPQQLVHWSVQVAAVLALMLAGILCFPSDSLAAGHRHVFPLQVTKSAIRDHDPTWCYNSKKNCHRTYQAADIYSRPGTKVRSIVAGTVFSKTPRATCAKGSPSLQIKGRDGRYYFVTHFAGGSVRVIHITISRTSRGGALRRRAQRTPDTD